MRKPILIALIAATAFPAVASAQGNGEIRRDRRELREKQRDVQDARRELREDVADRNRRWGDNDWRDWRGRNRAIYARGTWNAPFRYQAFRPGVRIAPGYWSESRFWIADPWRYRLPPAGWGQRWVRHYDDVLLIDTRRGVVVKVLRGFYF